jgi:hypothetical protein
VRLGAMALGDQLPTAPRTSAEYDA